MADKPESGALLADAAAEAGEGASGAPVVTIGFNGWQQYVKDRVVAGDSLGDAWSRITSIRGDVKELETAPSGGAGGMCDSVAARFPMGVFTLLLLPCIPLGFGTGCSAKGERAVVLNKLAFVFSGFVCIAFDRSLWLWALAVFAVWAYCVFWPLHYLFGVWVGGASSNEDHKFLAYIVQNFAVIFFTMPLHVTAMKVYNFRWSQRGQICRLMGVLYQLVVGCVIAFLFLVVDYLLVNLPRSPTIDLYVTSRPFTVFLVKRIGYSFIVSALNRHPSVSFRVTFLICMHLTLGVTSVSAACKCKTWQSLLTFVTVDTLVKLLGFYCFSLSGTEHLKNYRILRITHTILTKGKPEPVPGMVKGQYRAMEMLIQTISVNSLLLGLILTYFAIAYWLQDLEEFRPALQFWFPMRGYTVLVLLLLLVRELVYEQIAYCLADYKTGVDYRPVFRAWLREDSMIGWQGVLMTGLFTAFIPSLLTVTLTGFSGIIASAKA